MKYLASKHLRNYNLLVMRKYKIRQWYCFALQRSLLSHMVVLLIGPGIKHLVIYTDNFQFLRLYYSQILILAFKSVNNPPLPQYRHMHSCSSVDAFSLSSRI